MQSEVQKSGPRAAQRHARRRRCAQPEATPPPHLPILIAAATVAARVGGAGHREAPSPQRRASRRGHAALLSQSLDNSCGVAHMPTPVTTTSVVPGPFVFTLTTSHIWAKGGLMVVAIDWPIARGDRQPAASRMRSRCRRSSSSFRCMPRLNMGTLRIADGAERRPCCTPIQSGTTDETYWAISCITSFSTRSSPDNATGCVCGVSLRRLVSPDTLQHQGSSVGRPLLTARLASTGRRRTTGKGSVPVRTPTI
jgi:hypothetical protein